MQKNKRTGKMGKNKKLRKSIESFEERIKEHERKIEEYEGEEDSPIIDYWEKEIKNFKNEKKEREGKLEKK